MHEVRNENSGAAGVVLQSGVHNGSVVIHTGGAGRKAPEERLARAVAVQWSAEAKVRGLFGPAPMAITWQAPDGTTWLTGGDAAAFADRFLDLPAPRRLVLLGEAGCGKTSAAVLLLHGLLQRRQPGQPVPVLLSLGSWDPETEHLSQWLARRLAEEYLRLDPGGLRKTEKLLDAGLVLPVLDGLDEIPEPRRATALAKLNQALADRDPIVLTCRGKEYRDLAAEALGHATVVEARPLEREAVRSYLLAPATPERTARWQPVLNHLKAKPGGPLATTLTDPLMLGLTRTVYAAAGGRDPGELVTDKGLRTQTAIEQHLLDAVVPTAFPTGPTDRNAAHWRRHQWKPARAQRHLTYLARLLERQENPELAWWRLELDHGVGESNRQPLVTVAMVVMLCAATLNVFIGDRHLTLVPLLKAIGFPALIIGLALWVGGHQRRQAQDRPLRVREPIIGILQGTVFGVLLLAVVSYSSASHYLSQVLRIGAAVALLLPPAVLTVLWDRRQIGPEAASPAGLLARQRRRPLVLALMVAVVLFAGNLWLDHSLGSPYAWPPHHRYPSSYFSQLVTGSVCWALASSRWGAYQVTRLRLACTGHLPFRLMRFLDDAHHRGVLRQEGSVYQFRHARLRERLAGTKS
ncbi:NACHT domain-containing protein [Kitasatospora sp. NPDC058965]|uniref:NACHT domain-containing protein n=1 Tax=Kitasatospora sp. NPDC058965 TaxID=3346682 RepID=UPI0036BA7F0A